MIGVSMQLHDQTGGRGALLRPLLRARGLPRRQGGGRAPRHPPLRDEPRAELPRRGRLALRARLPRGPDAAALRAVQHRGEVREPRREDALARRLARGHGALRPQGPRGRGRPLPAAEGPGPREGPVVLPLRPHPGPARHRALPGGAPGEGRGAAPRARAGPARGRQGREPGDLLRPRRRLRRLRREERPGRGPLRPHRGRRRPRDRPPRRGAPLHGGAAARAGPHLAPAPLRPRGAAADEHRRGRRRGGPPRRSARGAGRELALRPRARGRDPRPRADPLPPPGGRGNGAAPGRRPRRGALRHATARDHPRPGRRLLRRRGLPRRGLGRVWPPPCSGRRATRWSACRCSCTTRPGARDPPSAAAARSRTSTTPRRWPRASASPTT